MVENNGVSGKPWGFHGDMGIPFGWNMLEPNGVGLPVGLGE